MSECSEVELMATRVLIDRRFCADTYHKELAEAVLALTAENKTLTKIFANAPSLPDTDVEWLEKTRALEAEINALRTGLGDAKYRIEQGRVWNGMGWTLTGLSSYGQEKAMAAIDAALAYGATP